MKRSILCSLCALVLIAPHLSAQEFKPPEPVEQIARAAPAPSTAEPIYFRIGGQDQSSSIQVVNTLGRELTAYWEAIPKTATEDDYNFPSSGPVTVMSGEFVNIPVTFYAEPLPGFLHQILEIFARDLAYRNWSGGEIVAEVLTQYGLDGLGYWVNDSLFGSFNFQGVGLTSDEFFTLRVEWRDENGNFYASQEVDVTLYDLDRPPILALRGTQKSESEDWFTNFDPDGVGFSQFFSNRDLVEGWLGRVSDPEQGGFLFRPHITGHSLGGALSQWFAASYTASGGDLGEIVTFASPGIMNRNVFGEGTSRFDRNRADAVTHYITSGDFVSLTGTKYLPGSVRQPALIPTWVKSQYVAGPESVVPGHENYKHSVPVLASFIDSGQRFHNPFPNQELHYDGNQILDDFFFSYLTPDNPDFDYFAFLQMVASSDAASLPSLPRVGPLLAAQLKYRGTAELNRLAIGRVLWSTPFLVTGRIQKAWEASKTWSRRAWQAIDEMTKKIVGSGSTLAKLNTGTATDTVNFWEASAQWPEEAWDASTQWLDFAWAAMVEWEAEQWAATVSAEFPWQDTPTWTRDQWDNVEAVPSKRIRGRVWYDIDGNGLDDGEAGLPGRVVFIDLDRDGALSGADLKTLTQGDGEFALITSALSAGSYDIRQDVEGTDWQITFPANGVHAVELDANPVQEIGGIDFGNFCVSGECEDDDGGTRPGPPPPPEALIINDDTFLLTYDDLGEEVSFPTGISSSDYACGVVGWQATGGDIRERSQYAWDDTVISTIRLSSENSAGDTSGWHLTAEFRTEDGKAESWDRVTILCFHTDVASSAGPEAGKPIFKKRFPGLGDNVRADTGIRVSEYACGIVGWRAKGGDINENGTGNIIQTYLYDEGGTWRIRADVRTHSNDDEDWDIDVMCLSNDIATQNGALPYKEYYFDRFTNLQDDIPFDTRIPFSDYVCGVVGYAALNGDLDERGKGAGVNLFEANMYAQDGTWRIRADFRNHGPNLPHWDVNVLCGLREGGTFPRNISREASGTDACLGEGMTCQVLVDELIDLSGAVVVTGGGFSGSPTETDSRCSGSDLIEVYANDRDITGKPRWSRPGWCLASGNQINLVSGVSYDFRSVSIVDGTTIPFQLYRGRTPLNLPPAISAPAPGFYALSWEDTLSFNITASDAEGDYVTIIAEGLPDGATIAPMTALRSVTGTFFWNPGANDVGSHEFTVAARDASGAESAPVTIFIVVCAAGSECFE